MKKVVFKMELVYSRLNHIDKQEVLVSDDFYKAFNRFIEDYQLFFEIKEQLKEKLSKLIDTDEKHRICYIYLQHMLKKGKYKFNNIPKFEDISEKLRAEVSNVAQLEDRIKADKAYIDQKYNDLVNQSSENMFNIFFKNPYFNNAVLIANYSMHKTLCRRRNKDLSKLWKTVMRGFAKSAPLSSYTSLVVDNNNRSKVKIDYLVILKLLYSFLQKEEVIYKSLFLIEYEEKGNKLVAKSCFSQLSSKSQFIGNEYKKYSLPLRLKETMKSGTILKGNELIVLFGGGKDGLEKVNKLQQCGFLINTILLKHKEPTLEELIDICFEFSCESESLQCIYENLKEIKANVDNIPGIGNMDSRKDTVDKIKDKVRRSFEILGADEFKNDINQPFLSENNYFSKEYSSCKLDKKTKENLNKIAKILPIFDRRLLLRFFIKDELELSSPKYFKDIKDILLKYLELYEGYRSNDNFKQSIFTQNDSSSRLYSLYESYENEIKRTLAGKDVVLQEEFLINIKNQLEKLAIDNTNYHNLLIQKNIEGRYFINNIQSSYLSYMFQHCGEKEIKKAVEQLKLKLQVNQEELALYCPSYGFSPNNIKLNYKYQLKIKDEVESSDSIGLDKCRLGWNGTKSRFELIYDSKKFLPVYAGTLAAAYLEEDYRIISYLTQDQFLNGFTINYADITIEDYKEIGEISFENIVIQRRKKILHNKLFQGISENLDGYIKFHKLKQKYQLPEQFFIRLFPINNERLEFIFAEKGLHKPIFIDIRDSFFFNQMLRHINNYLSKYKELAIVLEEANPNPYDFDKVTEELSVFI
jgi:hypothetical protein